MFRDQNSTSCLAIHSKGVRNNDGELACIPCGNDFSSHYTSGFQNFAYEISLTFIGPKGHILDNCQTLICIILENEVDISIISINTECNWTFVPSLLGEKLEFYYSEIPQTTATKLCQAPQLAKIEINPSYQALHTKKPLSVCTD